MAVTARLAQTLGIKMAKRIGNQALRQFQFAFGFLIFMVLPVGGLAGVALVWGIASLLHPSFLSVIVSDAPTTLELSHVTVLVIVIGSAMWFSFFAWKQWVMHSRLFTVDTRNHLANLSFPPDLERRRGPGWIALLVVTGLTLAAEILRRLQVSFLWIVLLLVVAIGAGCIAYSVLLRGKQDA